MHDNNAEIPVKKYGEQLIGGVLAAMLLISGYVAVGSWISRPEPATVVTKTIDVLPPAATTSEPIAQRPFSAPHRLAFFVEAAILHLQKDPPPKVILPDAPTPPAPPPPSPSAVQKVSAEQLYVFRCTVDCLVFTSPKGLTKITKIVKDAGPIQLYGKFTDGTGDYELRTYSEKYVYVLRAAGTGRVELIISPAGTDEGGAVCRLLDVDNGGPAPKPPEPGPGPGPKPDPPSPAPIPAAGLRVLIVYETADATKMPPAQQSILYGKPFRDYLNSKCVLGPDGKTREWRIWDQNVATSAESKTWQDAMARPRASVPWLVVSNGKAGWEGPLPANVDAAMAIIKKFEQ